MEDVYAGIVGVHGTRYSEAAVVTSAMKVSTTFGKVARLQGLDPVVDAFGGGEHGVSPACGWLREERGWSLFKNLDDYVEVIRVVVDCGEAGDEFFANVRQQFALKFLRKFGESESTQWGAESQEVHHGAGECGELVVVGCDVCRVAVDVYAGIAGI